MDRYFREDRSGGQALSSLVNSFSTEGRLIAQSLLGIRDAATDQQHRQWLGAVCPGRSQDTALADQGGGQALNSLVRSFSPEGRLIAQSLLGIRDAATEKQHRQWLDAVCPEKSGTIVAAAESRSSRQAGPGDPLWDAAVKQVVHEWFHGVSEGAWDPAKHPRGGNPKNSGEFSSAGGGNGGAEPSSSLPIQRQDDSGAGPRSSTVGQESPKASGPSGVAPAQAAPRDVGDVDPGVTSLPTRQFPNARGSLLLNLDMHKGTIGDGYYDSKVPFARGWHPTPTKLSIFQRFGIAPLTTTKVPLSAPKYSAQQGYHVVVRDLKDGDYLGSNAADPCIIVLLNKRSALDGCTAAAFHFQQGDPGNDVSDTLTAFVRPNSLFSGAHAALAGGNNDKLSRSMLVQVLHVLNHYGITIDGYSDSAGLYIDNTGKYFVQMPSKQ